MTRLAPTTLGDERGLALERAAVWLLTLALVAAVAGSVVLVADEVRRTTPETGFSVSFDNETRTVTVAHADGDPITDRVTRRLAVVLVDQSADTTSRVVWASDDPGPTDRGTGYPVEPGDTLTIDDPTVDADGDENFHDAAATVGFHIATDDTVRVVWTGNRQGGQARTVTLANATVG